MKISKFLREHIQRISTDYYKTEQRFDEILRTKLGRGAAVQRQKISTLHYGARDAVLRENVTALSGSSGADIDRALEGTALQGLGAAFADAEAKYGVNAYFLAGIAALESGYGTSKIALDKNNLFGFCAYDDSPYSSAKRFASREAGIDYVAGFLSKEYLSGSGRYYKGLSVDSVGRSYATDPSWADKVTLVMNELVSRAGAGSGS